MNPLSIAFIGAGKMATAIAAGLAKNMSEAQVRAFDISEKAAAHSNSIIQPAFFLPLR